VRDNLHAGLTLQVLTHYQPVKEFLNFNDILVRRQSELLQNAYKYHLEALKVPVLVDASFYYTRSED
jgi:hypothetical protein